MQRISALALCLLVLVTICPGQESRANLEGRVVDSQGLAIAGATVAVNSVDTGIRQETQTNGQGRWSIRFLNPGSYTITASFEGFKSQERQGIVLQVADTKSIDFTMDVGSVSEQITVVESVPLIDTTATTAGTVIEQAIITELPMLSRIPFQLAELSPGVQALDQDRNVPSMWSNTASSEVRINGGRDNRSNEFLLDGVPNQSKDRVAFIPSADAVGEFRVMTNAYDAQYGRQAGGTVNVSTKSGTNKYKGNLYEFNRNDALGANTFQGNRAGLKKSPVRYNLWGGTFGGPVKVPGYDGKDRTFFFVSYEGIRNSDPRAATRSVPTALERTGDFTQSWTTRVTGGVTERINTTIFDPTTIDGRRTIIDAAGKEVTNPNFGYRQPFAGNVIPKNRLSPVAMNVLNFVPLPNSPNQPTSNTANNFTPNTTRDNKMASILTRVDHNWNQNHKSYVSIRWNNMTETQANDFDNESTGNLLTRINRGLGLDHVWVRSANAVINIRGNVTRFEEPSGYTGTGFDPRTLGMNDKFVSSLETLSFPRFDDVFGGVGNGAGSFNATTYYNWNASLTKIDNNRTWRFGGEFRILQEATANYGNQAGQFNFNGDWTRRRHEVSETGYGSTLSSFMLGLPSGGTLNRNANRFDSMQYWGFYAQNDWRLTPRLTLNFGMRWDYQRPFIERFDRQVVDFDPTYEHPISKTAQAAYAQVLQTMQANPAQYPYAQEVARLLPVDQFRVYGRQLFAGQDGAPRTAVNNIWDQWQPRMGFAYKLTNSTVLRGGFGRFFQGTDRKGGQNGFSRNTGVIRSQDAGLTPYDTIDNPFRDGILQPTGASLAEWTNFGQGVNWLPRDTAAPYSWEYSLHLQHEWKSWLFEAGYSHNKTYNIGWDLQQNDIGYQNWSTLRVPRFDAAGKPLARPYITDEQIPNPFRGLAGVTGSVASNQFRSVYDLLRPLKYLGGQVSNQNPWGENQYDALLVKVQRRFNNGFSMLASYTFSKLFEDTSFWGPEISGPITEHKLGGEDRPHKLSIAPIFELPVGRGKRFLSAMPKGLDAVIGGWQLSGQYIIQSGNPIVFSTNAFYDGQSMALSRGERTLDHWFDGSHVVRFPNSNDSLTNWPAWTGVMNLPGASFVPTSSSDPRNGVYASFGNNVRRWPTRWGNLRASRVNEANLRISKNFSFAERFKLQVIGEAFNAFNHARFDDPNTDPGNSAYMTVAPSQLNLSRIVQIAMKLNF